MDLVSGNRDGGVIRGFAWVGDADGEMGRLQLKKGAGMGSAPFFSSTIFIISIRTGVHRQVLRIYFSWLFIDLAGKTAKRGLDKIFDGGC